RTRRRARGQDAHPAEHWNVFHEQRHIRHPARAHRPHRRGPELLSGPYAGTDPRALPRSERNGVLVMRQEIKLWSLPVLSRAVGMAFLKLDPRVEIRNPVMFMVWIGSLFISVVFIAGLAGGTYDSFNLQIA